MSTDASQLPQDPGWAFLAESASVVVLRLNLAGTILAANRQAEALVGEPLVGLPWHTLLLNFGGTLGFDEWLHRPQRPRLLNVRTHSGLPQTLEAVVERIGDDYLLFAEANATQQDRLGREVLELNHDLNNLTRELALKNGELAQLNALKNQFLGMAAHDLRKPIGLILSYAEFLMDEAGDALSAEQLDFLQTIHRAGDGMRRVVDDFLDVALIEAGRFNLDETATDLEDLVHAALTLVNLSALKRGVVIVSRLEPGCRHLFVDGPKIEQVLTNLLSNAVEHSQPGGEVSIESWLLPTEIRIQVTDKGAGITPVQQQRLFQSFASGQAGRKSTGERSIGLGLAIARKIVEAHDGHLYVQSEMGRGTVFGFSLPASRLSPARVVDGLSNSSD